MKKRLDYITLQYEYPDRGKQLYRQVISLQPLLQQNYGEALDCTITSLACIFGERYYGVIESIARRYGYDGERCGTNPLTVRRIMADFMKKQHMTGTARSGYGTIPAAQASGNAVKASLFEGSGSLKTALNAAITHYNNS